MEELLRSLDNLKVLLEVHPRQLKASKINSKIIVEFINDLGYQVHFFGSHRNNPSSSQKRVNPKEILENNTMFLIKR